MDILYYSNYCNHSKKILEFLTKNNLTDQLNFVCIDRRAKDPQNGHTYIVMENGNKVLMPPNVQSVPALLLVKKNYNVILGENIAEYLQPKTKDRNNIATMGNGEPLAYSFNDLAGKSNIVSEQYTFYNMSADDLSAKGSGEGRQMFNYSSINSDQFHINTPPDNYRPDKLSGNVTVDVLQQQRNEEMLSSKFL